MRDLRFDELGCTSGGDCDGGGYVAEAFFMMPLAGAVMTSQTKWGFIPGLFVGFSCWYVSALGYLLYCPNIE